MAICVECGASYSPKRLELGYRTCLDCGSVHAQREAQRKAKCCAPAYNKGAYQYVATKSNALGVGR
jgi:predicted  nucleic acid-binding Zn-ribbon protein